MNPSKLIFRNLNYYRKEHVLLFIGLVLSTAILTAALIIGDSVKFSLNTIVEKRLGKTQQIILTQERFFPAEFSKTLSTELKTAIAPVLMLRGMAQAENTKVVLPDVQVCGIDSNFWKMGNCTMPEIKENEVIINYKLADKLQLKVGDELFTRIEKISFVTENAPFVPTDDNTIALRMKVRAIADKQCFGDFNIQTNQITPATVFFSLQQLSKLNFDGNFANLMLISENQKSVEEINKAIKNCWTIDVINLKIRSIKKQDKVELISDKVFIEDTILSILKNAGLHPEPQFTYLINFIQTKNKFTPYSFVSALSHYPNFQLKGNELIINSWLAADLGAKVNDTLRLQYFTLESFRKLKEQTTLFVVKDIVDIKGFAADSLLMPAFEGLAGVDRCSDWEAGIPVDFSKIRDKDEAWWNKYKGTPKAFIAYEMAVELWGMNFGNSTSIRFDSQADTTKIKQVILNELQPAQVGLNIYDIKNNAGWSASNAVDFAQLFLALSFFLILAAFLLSGLLFSMLVVQRRKEQGVYLSMGLSQKIIYRIFFGEGLSNALISSFVGVFAGILLSQLVLLFLNSIWYDIVRTSSIQLFINPITLFTGLITNILIAATIIFLLLKSHFKRQIGELNKNINNKRISHTAKNQKISFYIGVSTAILLSAIVLYNLQQGVYQNSSMFLMFGLLLLISLTSWFAFFVLKSSDSKPLIFSNIHWAMQNLRFDFKRNIIISVIISIGIFIVISTGANRVDFKRDANVNTSGTGGFDFFVETNIGVNTDFSSAKDREQLGISENLGDVTFVQLLRYKSDDASCLNLNRIVRPSVLGLNPDKFEERNAFSFIKTLSQEGYTNWEILRQPMSENCIPAVADQTVITWGLGKSLGDSIMYTNERGQTIYLVLAGGLENSVFQGNLIISEENFLKHFPSISGSNIILADVKTEFVAQFHENLEGALRYYGVHIQSAPERLAIFNSVTNTYLDIFLALGGIALILGTFGIAIIFIRSINSRKNNYAMMQAIGISQKNIRKTIVIEFAIILFSGIIIGLLSAALASLQSLIAGNADVPFGLLFSIIIVFTANGFFWIYVGSRISVKSNFISKLRNE
ncbi:MAG: FtsX-like permease family protein [Paludibacter sp.]|nr:FtsX-like permease family protein [Paludibacter sp.]